MAGILIAAAAVAAYGVLGIRKHIPMSGGYFQGIVTATLILGVLMAAVIGYLLFYRKAKIEKIYPAAALFLAVMTFLALPTYSKPDEPQHFATAYELSNRMLGYDIGEGEYWFIVFQRQCDREYTGTELSVEQYNRFGETYLTDAAGLEVENYFDNLSTGQIIPYLVPALGITLGRIFHLGFGGIAALGTLFSAVFFILMTTYALHKLPFGKRMLFVIALLPMTLQQANSFSYDCSLIAAGIVVTALALRWRCAYSANMGGAETGPVSGGKYAPAGIPLSEWLMLTMSAVLLVSVKGGIYVPLLLLPVSALAFRNREGRTEERDRESAKPGERKRTGLLLYGIFAAILVTVIILWLSLGGAERIGDFLVRRHYVEWADAYGFSVMDYLTHPIDTLKILANTAIEKGGYYITTLLGGLLGWIDITISRKVMLLVALLLMLSLVRTKEDEAVFIKDPRCFGGGSRILLVVISGGICLFCVLSMLVYWTPMFSDVVEGAQGRYFLPVLPALLFGVGFWKKPVFRRSTDRLIAAVMPLVDFAVMLCIYINIVQK